MSEYRINKIQGILLEDDRVPDSDADWVNAVTVNSIPMF